jgi:hypothetical protein
MLRNRVGYRVPCILHATMADGPPPVQRSDKAAEREYMRHKRSLRHIKSLRSTSTVRKQLSRKVFLKSEDAILLCGKLISRQ